MSVVESPFLTTGLTNASGLAVAALCLCPQSVFVPDINACSHHKGIISLCTMHICCMVIVVSVQ